jgi:hypothetical protein
MHRRRARPDQIAHKAVVAPLRMRGVPGVVFLHPANGMGRTAVEGAILKSMGVMPGAPDLLIFHAGRSYALELKSDAGRVSETQGDMLRRLEQAGVSTAVAVDLDAAIQQLEQWSLLRGQASR